MNPRLKSRIAEQIVEQYPLQTLEAAITNRRGDLMLEHMVCRTEACETMAGSSAFGYLRDMSTRPGVGITITIGDAYYRKVGATTPEEKKWENLQLNQIIAGYFQDMKIPLPEAWSDKDGLKENELYFAFPTKKKPGEVQQFLDKNFAQARAQIQPSGRGV